MSNPFERVPPQNLEAERATLACCLLSADALTEVAELLTPADFCAERHQHLFSLMLELREKGWPVDRTTVVGRAEELDRLKRVGGADYVTALASMDVQLRNVNQYAAIVADKARRRRAQENLRKLAEELYDPDADLELVAVQAAWAIEDTSQEYSDVRLLGDVAAERVQAMRSRLRGAIIGRTYGFPSIDVATGGMESGKLILIAARPSMGKTGLALDIARRAAAQTNLVWLFIARDDAVESLADRALISSAQVSGAAYRLNTLTGAEWDRVAEHAERLGRVPVFATDKCRRVEDIRRRVRWLQKRYTNVGGVVVDYLQLLQPNSRQSKRYEQVGEVSQGLKALAVDLGVPVIALSQLSRAVEQRQDRRPVLSDLYESGQLEADAEVVMFLYREEYYLKREGKEVPAEVKGKVEVILAKQKNMPVGKVELKFNPVWVKFNEIEERYDRE